MDEFSKKKDLIEIPTLKELEGSLKQRIHNEGKDSENETIGVKGKRKGKYSPSYEKRKKEVVGEDVYPINLQLNGDLLRGYTVGTEGGRNVLKFQDDLSKKKMARHEKSYNTEIMKPSSQELDDMKEVLITQVEIALKEAFGV